MKKLINLECKKCRANLSEDENKGIFFCKYCGAKVILDNENEYIHRYIDDADLKRAETEQLVKLKELEIEEKKHEEANEFIKYYIFFTIFLLLCPVIWYLITIIISLIPWGLGLLFLYALGKKIGIVKKTNKNDL